MPQIFRRRSNTLARATVVGVIMLLLVGGWALHAFFWSPYATKVGMPQAQPVMFSHAHHVSGLRIDCRYCHTFVEQSSFAGMPPTETWMLPDALLLISYSFPSPLMRPPATVRKGYPASFSSAADSAPKKPPNLIHMLYTRSGGLRGGGLPGGGCSGGKNSRLAGKRYFG